MTSLVRKQNERGVKTLKSVIYQEFLSKAIVPIIFVEVALIIFYFITVNYMSEKSVEVMSQTAKQSLINLSAVEARHIDKKFKGIKLKSTAFQKMHPSVISMLYESFANEVMPKNLPWASGVLILNAQDNVLVSSNAFLDIVEQGTTVNGSSTISEPFTKQSLELGQTTIYKELSSLLAEQESSKGFTANDGQYFATYSEIEESGWKLVILTHLQNVHEPIYRQKAESQHLGYLIVLMIVAFYLIFSIYLMKTSKRFAQRITQPIKKISQFISQMNQHDAKAQPISYVQIKELDELIDLNVEIEEVKQQYRKINLEMSHKNKQLERLAVTDTLTQAFNRLKLDEVLSYEVARARRDKNPLSVVLLDIDNFKHVNDTFGHPVGDAVLVGITRKLSTNIRSTDVLGRWGGEEFLLVLPNTNLKNAGAQAEKLRRLIASMKFDEVGTVTASFGVSSCIDGATERSLIDAADQALYQAKDAGRNQVVCQEEPVAVKLELVNKRIDNNEEQNISIVKLKS